MKSWDPLNGTTNKRRFCHQLSVLRPDGSLDHRVGPLYPNQHGDFSYMQPAGYFIVQTLPPNAFEYYRVGLDGTRTLLGRITDGCTTGFVIPSPGGERLAFVRVQAVCSGPGSGSTATVSFFDATGAPIGGAATHAFVGYAAGTWTPAGAFVVSDGAQAVSVEVSGAVAAATVPGCTDPATTSSGVAADGRVLGFVDGKPGVIGVDPSRAFGCQ